MLEIELVPDLSHCIETVAKREYAEALRKLLAAADENVVLQERAELLRMFLETADFKELRRQSEKHLLAGRHVRFMVYRQKEAAKYRLQVE